MIGALFAVSVPGFALGAVGMAIANRRVSHGVSQGRWLKFAVFCAIVHAVLVAAILGLVAIRALYLGILISCGLEFVRAWRRIEPPRPWGGAIGAGLVAAGAVVATCRYGAPQLAWCFLVVACADGFAQVAGQLLGRRQLASRVSPTKTIEGAVGGVLAAIVVSFALRGVVGLPAVAASAWGAALAAAGLAGDLGASWVKRRAALKDFSRALPGQGGFLDRFDSLAAALALLAVAGPA